MDVRKLKQDFSTLLKKIYQGKPFEFAVGGSCPNFPSPGLTITNYGRIALPILETNIGDLEKYFVQAPYGLGEQTLVDTNVRDSLQLDPEKFQINNPKFNDAVDRLVEQVKKSLDCADLKVTTHLYKLLLYKKGGHFKPHRDTEKYPGMFATLILQLPSVFTGGDLIIKHSNHEKKVVFATADAEFSCMYAAHYADCEHELTEITSGYRLALVYSLCCESNRVIPTPPNQPTQQLAEMFKQMSEVMAEPQVLGWCLDHCYSEKSIAKKGVKCFKGGDKYIYSNLQGANALLEEGKKMDFTIVEAQRTDHLYGLCTRQYGGRSTFPGDCFYDDDLLSNLTPEYDYEVYSIEGHSINMDGLPKPEDMCEITVNGSCDFWGDFYKGKCSGPSGNEGSYYTSWYRRFILMFFPADQELI